MTFWTDDRISTLKDLAFAGLTATEIVDQMRAPSRNSVLGKLFRLGISIKKEPVGCRKRKWSPERAERQRAQRLADRNIRRSIDRARFKALEQLAAPAPPTAPEPRNLTILQLEAGDCRWPVTADAPYTFCAHAVVAEGQPYCRYHHKQAHA